MCIARRRMRLSLSILLGTSMLLVDGAAAGVNENRLWLPRAQHELKSQLVQAAQLVATSEECTEVISGEFDTDRSVANAPIFRIVCRNPAGYTYSVYVTDAGKPNARVEKVQGGAVAAEEDAEGKPVSKNPGNVDDKTAGKNCVAAVKRRTAHMTGIQLEESNLQRLESTGDQAQYEMDFDAADPSGMALHFLAVCRVSPSGTALVEIRPRRVDKMQAASKAPASAAAPQRDAETDDSPKPAAAASKSGDSPLSKSQSTGSKPADTQSTDDGWEVVE